MNDNAGENMSRLSAFSAWQAMFVAHRRAWLTARPLNLSDKLGVRANFNVWNLEWMTDMACSRSFIELGCASGGVLSEG